MFILAIGDVVEAFGGWVVMGVVVNWGVCEWVDDVECFLLFVMMLFLFI